MVVLIGTKLQGFYTGIQFGHGFGTPPILWSVTGIGGSTVNVIWNYN